MSTLIIIVTGKFIYADFKPIENLENIPQEIIDQTNYILENSEKKDKIMVMAPGEPLHSCTIRQITPKIELLYSRIMYFDDLLTYEEICDRSELYNVYTYVVQKFSQNEFKHYKNIIIHYTGKDNNLFINKISSILSLFVIDELEYDLLNKNLIQNYFYFDSNERKKILDLCFEITTDDFGTLFDKKFNFLHNEFFNFISVRSKFVRYFDYSVAFITYFVYIKFFYAFGFRKLRIRSVRINFSPYRRRDRSGFRSAGY